ncbi:MAG: hypothetical protein ACPGF8_06835 [Opitutales bacterium]
MKKLLISFFLIAAVAGAHAHCGACGPKKCDSAEKKCDSTKKCDSEKKCDSKKAEKPKCCPAHKK